MTYPFKLGTTSFIIPDDIIPNARYLAGKVDDIQLILFESDTISLPTDEDVRTLTDIAEPDGMRYSIHFPLDTILGAPEPIRSQSVQKHIQIINTTLPLKPSVYIIHFNGDSKDHAQGMPSDDIERWQKNNLESMREIIEATDIDPSRLCVETLSYPFELAEEAVYQLNLSVCIDVGHLLLYNESVEEHFARYAERIKSIHLHGTSGDRDHLDLSHLDTDTLDTVLKFASDKKINLTIEVFNEKDFLESMKVLSERFSIS
ncbi:hypothetical protein BVX97_06255 [bacterium E08(2017)]|nr:hypothetical protein BVX97_06255 [bacterium E08(2017)]